MAKQTVKTIVKTRVRKDGKSNSSGYEQCNMCHGTGVVKSKGKSK